ncbi:MAG: MATE family efflux transporter [Muribaculaceae bacterium]|nr:MATE family efflux transporter [Muribaculaceae bacterium]
MTSTLKKSNKIDMLNGPLMGKILLFALPLMASGALQQSFNSVDVAVVGRYCNPQSLAAVGSNGMIISLIVNLFLGISVGANVVIAHYIGRKDNAAIKKAVDTVMSLAIICGVILLISGVATARPILEAISTPHDVIDLATVYLRIYFLGMPFFMIYNFGSAILRSIGDTRRPFYCLVAGGIVNVILNLVLVLFFNMGVAGVAIATVASNIVSALLLLVILAREEEPYRVNIFRFLVYRPELGKMLKIGMPAGIQGMVFSFSNIFIVSGINTFGAAGSAGSAAALNFEYYCYFVIVAFNSAAVAFTGQNYGAGKIERCNRVFALCFIMALVGCAILNVLIVWQKEFFISFFTNDPEVARFGYIRLTVVLLFQFLATSYEVSGACMRGLGYSMTPTVLTIFGTCLLRIAWVYLFHHTTIIEGMNALLMVYPLSWTLTGISVLAAYFIIRRKAYRKIVA